MTREELVAKYGWPTRVDNRDDNIFVFRHDSLEAAEAYAVANIEHYDHPSTVEWSPQLKAWLSLTDIQPAVDRWKRELDKNID